MGKKLIIFSLPFIALLEIISLSFITEMLRTQSDVAVLIGVFLICAFMAANYFLISFLIKQFKQEKV